MKNQMHKIAELVKKHSQADDFELKLNYKNSHSTRFAQNAISQHLAGENLSIRYKAYFNNQCGSCAINDSSESAIVRMIKTAEETAKYNQPDPEYAPSLHGMEYPLVINNAEATLALAPLKMVEIIKESIDKTRRIDAVLSGIFEKHVFSEMLVTKNGFEGHYDFSFYDYSMTIKKGQAETKVSICEKDFANFNQAALLQKLFEQCEALKTQKSMDFGKMPVILRPAAVSNLFMYLYWIMNRKTADEGLTPFTDQMGKRLFGEKFTLKTVTDDFDLIIHPFNADGITRPLHWVREGIVENLPINRSWAKKINETPSIMTNTVIEGGDVDEEAMMQKVSHGLILNNFWYIRPNDMKTADFTGMTRDGVLYFENGKVQHGVNNFRFNEKLHEVTRRILALGPSVIVYQMGKAPTMLINDFNFVDKTTF